MSTSSLVQDREEVVELSNTAAVGDSDEGDTRPGGCASTLKHLCTSAWTSVRSKSRACWDATPVQSARAWVSSNCSCCSCSASRKAYPVRAAPILLCLLLIAVVSSLVIGARITTDKANYLPNFIGKSAIVSLEIVGIIAVIWLMRRGSFTERDAKNEPEGGNDPWLRVIRQNIRLFGMVPFYIPVVAYDLLHIVADGSCHDELSNCENYDVRSSRLVNLAYRPMRVAFMFAEVMLCVHFRHKEFDHKWCSSLCLALLLAANVSLWLGATVDVDFGHGEGNTTWELAQCFTGSPSNRTLRCFHRQTVEYSVVKTAEPYLHPFAIEFLVLVVECITSWYFQERVEEKDACVQTEVGDEEMNALVSSAVGPRGGDEERDATGMGPETDRVSDQRGGPPAFAIFMSLFGIMINIVVIIVCIMLNVADERKYKYLYACYRSVYWLVLLLVGFVGCCVSARIRYPDARNRDSPAGSSSNSRRRSDSEGYYVHFVIACCIGPFLQTIFTMVANIKTDNDVSPTAAFLCEEVLNVLEVVVQVLFYFYGREVSLGESGNNERKFKWAVLFYAISNGAMWIADSFIETRNVEQSFQQKYYDYWPLLYNITNPLTLIFRFNSMLLFLDVFLRRRSPPRSSR